MVSDLFHSGEKPKRVNHISDSIISTMHRTTTSMSACGAERVTASPLAHTSLACETLFAKQCRQQSTVLYERTVRFDSSHLPVPSGEPVDADEAHQGHARPYSPLPRASSSGTLVVLSTAHCVQHSAQAVHSSPPFHSLKSSIYSTDSRVRFMCASQSTQASRIVSARACAEFWNASLRACSDRVTRMQ
jgi:hypothetical protein